jgi:O-antigen/teichoic acid export membrane protein
LSNIANALDLKPITDQVILGTSGFVTVIALGRYSDPAELGIYSLVIGLVMLFSSVPNGIVSKAFVVLIAGYESDRKTSYAYSSICLLLVLGTVITLLILLPPWLFGHIFSNTRLSEAMMVAGCICSIFYLKECLRQYAYAYSLHFEALQISAHSFALQTFGLILLIASNRLTVISVLILSGVSSLLVSFYWLYKWRNRFQRASYSEVKTDWKRNWIFGRWLSLAGFASTLTGYAMPWIVAIHVGPAGAGLLAASTSITGIANHFIAGLSNPLIVRAAVAYQSGGIAELVGTLFRGLILFLCLISGIVAFLFVYGQSLADFLYKSKYPEVGNIVEILSFSMLITCFGIVSGYGLLAINLSRITFWADISRLVTSLVIALLAVPIFGVVGGAWALLCGASVASLINILGLLITLWGGIDKFR